MIKLFKKPKLAKTYKDLISNKFKWLLIVGLLIGLVCSVLLFTIIEDRKDMKLEITFLAPREAIIFWKTEYQTIGYVKYGNRNNYKIAHQTSSEPGHIHAVLLEDIPLDGLYFSLHTQNDSFFRWPKKTKMVFDPTIIE